MRFIRYTSRDNIKCLKNHDMTLAQFIEQTNLEEDKPDFDHPDFLYNIKITIEIDDESNNRI